MQNPRIWLKKAENDLKGAKILLNENINDLAIYHVHQCVEKALKGYLVFKKVGIQKSHDLVLLTEQCNHHDQNFGEIREIVEALNPFGTLVRYPSDKPDPNQEITKKAIIQAEIVLNFVQSKIQS